MASLRFTDLFIEVSGIFLHASPARINNLCPRSIKTILDSPYWHRYEKGQLSREQCYDEITAGFELELEVLDEAMGKLSSNLELDHELVAAIKGVKTAYPGFRVHAFLNISSPDYDMLKSQEGLWESFDSVLTSASLGHRKPELGSYQKVLSMTGAAAEKSIFVDDRVENVSTAHSLGFHGIVFKDRSTLVEKIHNLLGDPVFRGLRFLHQRAGELHCETDQHTVIKDNFSQLLIFECTKDRSLVAFDNDERTSTWQFFIGERAYTDHDFPQDADTTSLALVTLDVPRQYKEAAMEAILNNLTEDGLPLVLLSYINSCIIRAQVIDLMKFIEQAYFEELRPRFCPYILANVLRLFFLNGQGHKLGTTLNYLCRFLHTRAYELGSRYYRHPDWILYYTADLCGKCADADLDELRRIVTSELQRRMGSDKDVFAAALRLQAAHSVGLHSVEDLRTILDAQRLDGGWETAWMFTFGNVSVQIGSRGVMTAMCVKAIQDSQRKEPKHDESEGR